MEEWRDINNYEGLYQVSNLGRVKSVSRKYLAGNGCVRIIKEHLLNQYQNRKGYLEVKLYSNGIGKSYKVHRLVADAFIPNPENKPCVDHIDGNKQSNITNNLRWVTNKENCNNPNTSWKNSRPHTYEWKGKMSEKMKGTPPSKQCINAAKELHKKKVNKYKNGCLVKTYDSLTEASNDVGVTISAITKAINNHGTCRGFVWELMS